MSKEGRGGDEYSISCFLPSLPNYTSALPPGQLPVTREVISGGHTAGRCMRLGLHVHPPTAPAVTSPSVSPRKHLSMDVYDLSYSGS